MLGRLNIALLQAKSNVLSQQFGNVNNSVM